MEDFRLKELVLPLSLEQRALAQRSEVTYPRTHSWIKMELGGKARSSDPHSSMRFLLNKRKYLLSTF